MDSKRLPSVESVRAALHYDPNTGVLTRRIRTTNSIRVGDAAGCYDQSVGYLRVRLFGVGKWAHQWAWYIMTGFMPNRDWQVDHINCVKTDNRWCNLRLASPKDQRGNVGRLKSNTSGFKGVTFHKQNQNWNARITINDRYKHLGVFETKEQAAEAYAVAAREYFGEFVRIE